MSEIKITNIRPVSEEERERLLLQLQEIERQKKEIRKEKFKRIGKFFASILFPPFEITLNAMHVILKILGGLLSIGLPYGIYCIYKMIVTYQSGVSILEMEHYGGAMLFGILPFIAFALAMISDKISFTLYCWRT